MFLRKTDSVIIAEVLYKCFPATGTHGTQFDDITSLLLSF